MRLIGLALAIAMILGFAAMSFAGQDEPHWSEVVKTYYPYWKSHYWVDRELWGNQGYIIGGPPKRLSGDQGKGAMNIETVVIKEEPLQVTPKKTPEKPTTHKVKKGECLWYIAGYDQIYGNPLKWPLIYKANKDKIKNPDLIYPGQVLTIPRD